MLSHIFSALTERLSRLPWPLYLQDCVPEGAAFPYATAEIAAPLTPGAEGSLALTVWTKGSAAHSERIAQAELLHQYLPLRGAWLAALTGSIILVEDGPVRCVQDGPLLGVESRWTLHFFPSV